MQPRDPALLLDIVLAARRIQQFVRDANYERFASDDMLRSAVYHQITVIGEAARQVSDETKSAHVRVDWRGMIATRNILVHAYTRVDDREIWRIVTMELSPLIGELEPLIPPP